MTQVLEKQTKLKLQLVSLYLLLLSRSQCLFISTSIFRHFHQLKNHRSLDFSLVALSRLLFATDQNTGTFGCFSSSSSSYFRRFEQETSSEIYEFAYDNDQLCVQLTPQVAVVSIEMRTRENGTLWKESRKREREKEVKKTFFGHTIG